MAYWLVKSEPSVYSWEQLQKEKKPGDIIHLQVLQDGAKKDISFIATTRFERPFTVSRMVNANSLQVAILKDWLKGK